MKIFDLVAKDMRRNLRNIFTVVMIFAAPLLITGIIYLAFGGAGGTTTIQPTRLVVVNLDQPMGEQNLRLGDELAGIFQSNSLSDLIVYSDAPDEAAARKTIEDREADVVLVIPADFSAAIMGSEKAANFTLLHDPAKTLQPKVVQAIVEAFINAANGSRIALDVAQAQFEENGLILTEADIQEITAGYTTWVQGNATRQYGGALQVVVPGAEAVVTRPILKIMAGIMAAMLVYFMFFTGATWAESIIKEDEEKTLARLATTPTTPTQILGSKILGAFLMIAIQVIVLVVLSRLVFGVQWGELLPLTLVLVSADLAAAGFGIFALSLIKTTKQVPIMMGGVLTVTSMLGVFPAMLQSVPTLTTVSKFTPQGWAVNALKTLIDGGGLSQVLLPIGVLLVMAAVCFIAGVLLFRRRFK